MNEYTHSMITRLTGTLVDISPRGITLDVRDVGYGVLVTEHWKSKAVIGNNYMVYIYTHVKEDALDLFGFSTTEERHLFELLLSVSGVGPKTALAIVSQGVQAIQQAIVTADVAFFSGIPRIGKKNAQKIIIELKSKLGGLVEVDLSEDAYGKRQELLDALIGMGFSRQEVAELIKEKLDEKASIEDNIRKALKILGKK